MWLAHLAKRLTFDLSRNPDGRTDELVSLTLGTVARVLGPQTFDVPTESKDWAAIHTAVWRRIAAGLGHDCLAALIDSKLNVVKASFFDLPQCNEAPAGTERTFWSERRDAAHRRDLPGIAADRDPAGARRAKPPHHNRGANALAG